MPNPIQQKENPLQGVFDALEQIGTHLVTKGDEERKRMQDISRDPLQSSILATRVRQAYTQGRSLEEIAQGMGFTDENAASFLQSVTEANPQSSVERSEEIARLRDIPDLAAREAIATSAMTTRRAEAGLELDEPEREAAAAATGSDLSTIQNQRGLEFEQRWLAMGGRAAESKLAYRQLEASGLNVEATIDAWGQYTDLVQSWKNSNDPALRHYAEAAATALANPNALTHIGQHERFDFELELARARVQQTNPVDQVKNTAEWMDRHAVAVKGLVDARESKDEFAIQAAERHLENTRRMIKDMQAVGMVIPIDVMGVDSGETYAQSVTSPEAQLVIGGHRRGILGEEGPSITDEELIQVINSPEFQAMSELARNEIQTYHDNFVEGVEGEIGETRARLGAAGETLSDVPGEIAGAFSRFGQRHPGVVGAAGVATAPVTTPFSPARAPFDAFNAVRKSFMQWKETADSMATERRGGSGEILSQLRQRASEAAVSQTRGGGGGGNGAASQARSRGPISRDSSPKEPLIPVIQHEGSPTGIIERGIPVSPDASPAVQAAFLNTLLPEELDYFYESNQISRKLYETIARSKGRR